MTSKQYCSYCKKDTDHSGVLCLEHGLIDGTPTPIEQPDKGLYNKLNSWWWETNGTGTGACVSCANEDACGWHSARLNDLVSLIESHTNAARAEELRRIPWKSVKRYSIERPYLTKEYWVRRLTELEKKTP
jgi:hypothetical protein